MTLFPMTRQEVPPLLTLSGVVLEAQWDRVGHITLSDRCRRPVGREKKNKPPCLIFGTRTIESVNNRTYRTLQETCDEGAPCSSGQVSGALIGSLRTQALPTNHEDTSTCCCTCSCYRILCCNMPFDKNFWRKRACVRPRFKEHCAAMSHGPIAHDGGPAGQVVSEFHWCPPNALSAWVGVGPARHQRRSGCTHTGAGARTGRSPQHPAVPPPAPPRLHRCLPRPPSSHPGARRRRPAPRGGCGSPITATHTRRRRRCRPRLWSGPLRAPRGRRGARRTARGGCARSPPPTRAPVRLADAAGAQGGGTSSLCQTSRRTRGALARGRRVRARCMVTCRWPSPARRGALLT